MYADFPPHRLVSELVQNSWDEKATECRVDVEHRKDGTLVRVSDNNPDGFKDLRHAYTLFASTAKRSDPTKRGRFNLGEKLVFARAISAKVITTTGTICFDEASGRTHSDKRSATGSIVEALFPKWGTEEAAYALSFLTWLYPPKGISYYVGGVLVPHVEPFKTRACTLPTDCLETVAGQSVMKRTKRKTEIHFLPLRDRCDTAYLFEMGIPVCPIEGKYDADVQQKVPLDKDRTMVPEAYLQDIYAEMLMALGQEIAPDSISSASMRMALEDTRTDPETAALLLKRCYGDRAVLQSHDPDSDQQAVRAGATLVPSRTFGADVNDKLRLGGIQTAKEAYCRNVATLTASGLSLPGGFRTVEETPVRQNFAAYTRMLGTRVFGTEVDVEFAHWMNDTQALYHKGAGRPKVTFNVFKVPTGTLTHPVTKGTALILHEMAHACGDGHDGVYDHEFENAVDRHTALLVKSPDLYRKYEPDAFAGAQ